MTESARPQYFGRDLEAMTFADNYHRWIVDRFQPYIGDDTAEIGAGIGNFSRLLRPHTARLTAYEPSENMYPVLHEQFANDDGVTTHNGFFGVGDDNGPTRFDTVLYVNVLEHIEDDKTELERVLHALKPGGHLLVFVPALSFLYSDLDKQVGHYRRYHKRPLAELVQQVGFELDWIRYFDLLGIAPWYIAFTLLGRSVTGSNVSLYDRIGVPITRSIERVINPPAGKNQILVARKP